MKEKLDIFCSTGLKTGLEMFRYNSVFQHDQITFMDAFIPSKIVHYLPDLKNSFSEENNVFAMPLS